MGRLASNRVKAGPEILVVDDDDIARRSVVRILERARYRVLEARTGLDALELLRGADHLPSLVLLDVGMPVMNGWGFRAEQINDPRLATIPVVVISGEETLAQKSRAMQARGYVTKPFGAEELLQVVAQACGPAA